MSLSDTLKRGVKYTAIGQFATYGIRFGSNLLLTRLLAPDLFGVMAVAMVFVYAAAMLCDVGLRSAIIAEKRADDSRFRDIVWTVMTFRVAALTLFVGLFAVSILALIRIGFIPEGSAYADPRLNIVFAMLVLAESFRYMESVEVLYRERQMNFSTVFRLDLARQLISTATTLTWAWLSPGIVALCAGSVVANASIMVASYVWVARRGPRFIWSPQDFLFLWTRGKWLWVSAILTFSMNILDRVYLAKYFDSKQMGLHSIAVLYGFIVIDLVYKFSANVIFPLVSQSFRDEEKDLWRTYYKSLFRVIMVALPSGFFFITFGDKLIEFLYDPRYHEAGALLRAFGVIALCSVYMPAGEVYVALGQAKIKSQIYFVRLVALLGGLLLMVPSQGLIGGVWALTASHLVGALVSLHFNRKLGLFRWSYELKIFGAYAAIAASSFAIRAIFF